MQMALLFIDRECRFDKLSDQTRVQSVINLLLSAKTF